MLNERLNFVLHFVLKSYGKERTKKTTTKTKKLFWQTKKEDTGQKNQVSHVIDKHECCQKD